MSARPRWLFTLDHVPNNAAILDGMLDDAMRDIDARLDGPVSIRVTYYQPDRRVNYRKVGGERKTNMLLDALIARVADPYIVGTEINYRSAPLRPPCVEVCVEGYGGAIPM